MNTSAQEKANQEVELRKAEINKVMQQLAELRSRKLLDEAKQQTSNFGLDEIEIELENKLKSLGVNSITPSQAQAIYSKQDLAPNVAVPPSNSNVRWYEIRYSNYRDGAHYELQDLYAQGVGYNTNLVNAANGRTLYENQDIRVNLYSQIAGIYVEKFIGAALQKVPVINWAPWELFFANNDKVSSNSHVITYRSTSTVCFTYVKQGGQNDNYQQLSFVSNMHTISSSHTVAGIDNGRPYSKTTDKDNTVYADAYANGSKAVDSYNNPYAQKTSFVKSFHFHNHDKSKTLSDYLVNPSSPAQITQ